MNNSWLCIRIGKMVYVQRKSLNVLNRENIYYKGKASKENPKGNTNTLR